MKRKQRNLAFKLSLIVLILAIPLILIQIINQPPPRFLTESEVNSPNRSMLDFTLSHYNDKAGLFIYPDLEANYWMLQALPFLPQGGRNNWLNKSTFGTQFLYYFWNLQKDDGGFGSEGNPSSMYDSYFVVSTIAEIDSQFFSRNENQARTNALLSFIRRSLYINGSGFKANPLDNMTQPDMRSTFSGLEMLNIIAPTFLTKDQIGNLSRWLFWCYRFSGYALDLTKSNPDLQSTYYGVQANLRINNTYSGVNQSQILSFVDSCRGIDYGYGLAPLTLSTLTETWEACMIYKLFGLPIPYLSETRSYVLSCNSKDGGFTNRALDTNNNGTFPAVACAFMIINWTNNIFTTSYLDQVFNWIEMRITDLQLFGKATIHANYYGLLTIDTAPKEYLPDPSIINFTTIGQFILTCYNYADGGFGLEPNASSSLLSTYEAIQSFVIMNRSLMYRGIVPQIGLPPLNNITNYIELHWNPLDGGYRMVYNTSTELFLTAEMAVAIQVLEIVFGPYISMYNVTDLINENSSMTVATYWAIASLNSLFSINDSRVAMTGKWLQSCQNHDGGFGLTYGVISDVISSYYSDLAIHILKITAYSSYSLVKFLHGAQAFDGGFYAVPMVTLLVENPKPSEFTVSFDAANTIYNVGSQPDNVSGLIQYLKACWDPLMNGTAGNCGSGAKLEYQANAMILYQWVAVDRSVRTEEWVTMLNWILIVEIIGIGGLAILLAIKNIFIILNPESSRVADIERLKNFPAINVRSLNVYAGKKAILKNCYLQLGHGQILGVLGESGAGKSTFVKALLGMRDFTGINEIYGMNIGNKGNQKRLKRLYGYVPQDLSKIYENFTVTENLMTFGIQYGLDEDEIYRRSQRILRALGISSKADELVSSLSGGQKRRVSIAIALVHNPILCVLDEPTSGLDPVVRTQLWLSLLDLNERLGTTLIVITHYPEESRFCNKVAIFGRGRGLVDYGTPQELLSLLPGKGRAIELELTKPIPDSEEFLKKIGNNTVILSIKDNEKYIVFTDTTFIEFRNQIQASGSILANKIKRTEYIEAQMEDFLIPIP